METKIDNVKTIEAVRGRYGSIVNFCRQADIGTPHFYLIVTGQRGHGRRGTGPAATKSPLVLQRLRDEGLLVEVPVESAVND
ncbi:MAG: hypothetical protein FDZ69_07590 [Deltaproteobacteria bacterium]|nr:MAG: hypothetical protein FDZ69_07590 [Deltaproteobacteria bacterium]